MPNYADFQSVVTNETDRAVLLTGSSIALLFTALGEYLENSENWQGSADFGALTPEEKDTVEAEIARAERELMTEYGGANVSQTGIIFMSPADRDNALYCDGSQYLRVDYPDLYAFLAGSVYIVDADNFIVPDLREVFILGDDTPGGTGGEATHVLTLAEMPYHTHKSYWTNSATAGGLHNVGNTNGRVGQETQYDNVESVGSNQPHENMPPYHKMRFYIWT